MNEILEILKEYRAIFQRGGRLCEDDIIDLQNQFNKFIEVQEAKSCDGCEFFGDDRKCWQTTIVKYISCERHTFELAMVDRFKLKG